MGADDKVVVSFPMMNWENWGNRWRQKYCESPELIITQATKNLKLETKFVLNTLSDWFI